MAPVQVILPPFLFDDFDVVHPVRFVQLNRGPARL